jgi:thiamine biosynthesis lipoprotein
MQPSASNGLNVPVPLSPGYLLEIGRDAMACRFEVLLHPGQPTNGPELACHALETISYLEDQWSLYRPASELSLINARAETTAMPISESTKTLVALGLELHRRTEGAFDLTATKLSKAWGFFRRQGIMPGTAEIEQALREVGSHHIQLDNASNTIRYGAPIEINPGGIGKGVAIDMAADWLEDHGVEQYAFHGGKSSIRCRGKQEKSASKTGWGIAVRHPEQSERLLGTLKLFDQSLGTSGPANQFFYFQGKRFGHIIDPRTGWPAEGMLSVTILHPNAGWADALATGLYVLGIDRAIAYCENNPDTAMLAILPGERSGQVEIVTCNLQPEQWIPS